MPPVRYYNGFGYRSWTIPGVQVLMPGSVPIQGSPSLSVRTKCVSKEERTWMLVKVEVVLFLHFYVSNREFLIFRRQWRSIDVGRIAWSHGAVHTHRPRQFWPKNLWCIQFPRSLHETLGVFVLGFRQYGSVIKLAANEGRPLKKCVRHLRLYTWNWFKFYLMLDKIKIGRLWMPCLQLE